MNWIVDFSVWLLADIHTWIGLSAGLVIGSNNWRRVKSARLSVKQEVAAAAKEVERKVADRLKKL